MSDIENINDIRIENQSLKEKQSNLDSESDQKSDFISKKSNISRSYKSNKKSDADKSYEIEILPENTTKYDLSFKIIVIGDSYVGKSSLSNKAIKNKFELSYSATLGFDYYSFYIKIEKTVIKLQIWDTCGQEIYQSLITNFYRNSSLAIMVYAIDNRSSFDHIDNWLKEIKKASNPDAKIFLIGNKIDKEEERKVSYEEAEKYANDLDLSRFYESSAKNGYNVQKIFIEAACVLYEDYIDYKSVVSHNISTISEPKESDKVKLTNIEDNIENNNENNSEKNSDAKNKKKGCC